MARMEGSTLTRPTPGTDSVRAEPSSGERGDRAAKIVFALLCVGFAIGFFVFPTYPVYDSYYSLLWGRDLLHGDPLVFDGFRYPTEHPLAIAAGAVLQLFGSVGDRLWVAMILGSFLVLVAGVYRLGRIAATPLVGAIAAALLLTRFDYPFLAARGYIDIPYMALVVWAATLEATTAAARRAGADPARAGGDAASRGVVPGGDVLRLGGLEGDVAPALPVRRDRRGRPADVGDGRLPGHRRPAVLAARTPSDSAEDLGRQRPLSELPSAIPGFFENLVKLPVLAAAGGGRGARDRALAAAHADAARAAARGRSSTFIAIGVAGASVIERYLAVPALALMVLAAVTIGGWTMLLPGWIRTGWMIAATADRAGRRAPTRRRI